MFVHRQHAFGQYCATRENWMCHHENWHLDWVLMHCTATWMTLGDGHNFTLAKI